MDEIQTTSTHYLHNSSLKEMATSSHYSFSSSTKYESKNVPNSLQYSATANTPRQQQLNSMKTQFLDDSKLNKPPSKYLCVGQPLESGVQRAFVTNQPLRPVAQSSTSISLRPSFQSNLSKPINVIVQQESQPPPPISSTIEPTKKDKRPTFFSRLVSSFRRKRTKRGYAIIFNHEIFNDKTSRTGTQHDVNELTKAFEIFNIETHVKHNLTLSQLKQKVKKLKKFNFSNYECFIIVILTHGEGRQFYAKDTKYDFIEVVEDPILKSNATLIKKPKIFITQASHENVITTQTDAKLVTKCEIFKSRATHFISTTHDGTLFVKTFCRHLQTRGQFMNLYELMTGVNKEVLNCSVVPEAPTIESTMTKSFCFGKLLE